MIKKLLSKITNNFKAKINARLRAYRKAGIDESIVSNILSDLGKIEGFSTTSSGYITISKDLSEVSILSALKIAPKAKALVKEITAPAEEAMSEAEKAEKERIAKMQYEAEVQRLRNRASEDLWDIWYSKHEGGWDKRDFERQTYINYLPEDIRADIADKLSRLGTSMGINDASAEEIMELYNEIKEELAKVGVEL